MASPSPQDPLTKNDGAELRATDEAQTWRCPNGCVDPQPAWWPAPPGETAPPCSRCDAPLEDATHPPGWRSHAHYSIAVDFDGVIHSYLSPWEGAHIIPDPPVVGALDWLEKMAQRFHVIIFSTRCLTFEGCRAVREYLYIEHNTAFHVTQGIVPIYHPGLLASTVGKFECTASKQAALIYLDDRAVRFDGTNFPTADDIHQKLIPWNKKQGLQGDLV